MSKWLLVSFLNVSLKTFPFCFITSPLPSFQSYFVVFNLTQMKFLKDFWVQAHCSALRPSNLSVGGFPIFNEGVGLISLKVIALTIYLGSWALVAFVIASKFLLNFHLFFVGNGRCEQLGAIFFPSSFEINAKFSFPRGCSMCAPF